MRQYPTLRIGSSLQGGKFTYTIQSVLGQGSFGITYLAAMRAVITGPLGNIDTEVKVAIKEFFMRDFSSRREDGSIIEMTDASLVQNYLKKFRKEAENLAKLNHPNIVNVLEVFEANNTCYYAMQFLPGGSLDDYVKGRGGLPEAEAVACIRQIGEAVQYMHDHRMLHLDLKPSNVMRSEDGQKMVLIDFGLSKQYGSDGNPESSTTIGLGTAGYAPIEQSKSDRDKEFAPTLDVYALGATFFKLLTATTPPDSSDVLNEGLPINVLRESGVSQTSIAAIESAMEPRKTKRVQSVTEFLNLLSARPADEITHIDDEPTVPIPPQPQPKPQPTPHPAPHPRKSLPKWPWGVVAALVVGTAMFGLLRRPSSPSGRDVPLVDSVPTVTEVTLAPVTTERMTTEPLAQTTPVEPAVVVLESLSLSKKSLELEEGANATLTANYVPANATDKSTVWESSNESVAKVSPKGKVTAVSAGNAAIAATCGSKTAYCNVTVTPKTSTTAVATPTASTSTADNPFTPSSTTGKVNGHEWIDLGLSVKWATMNVGAASPIDYGHYYAWGETKPKNCYDWSNCFDCYDTVNTSDDSSWGEYKKNVDTQINPTSGHDAARANWGGSWRLPTRGESEELCDQCTWTWGTKNGVKGYTVTGPNGNSIFLSAAGFRTGLDLRDASTYGAYWSSTLSSSYSNYARGIYFHGGNHYADETVRKHGRSVRPVTD